MRVLRPAALLALLLPLAGCASTQIIDASNPADLARVQAREVGRTADITLTSGDLYRGALVFLRPDSTAWAEDAGVFAVPTDDVVALVVDTRKRALTRGALVGSGIGFGLCFVAGAAFADDFGGDSGQNLTTGLAFGALCMPTGAVYGLIGGAVSARRTEYVFVDPEPGAEPEPEPDAPDTGDGE